MNLHWFKSDNFGDNMNPWYVENTIGNKPDYIDANNKKKKYIFIGSILNWADENTTVWGAGLANQSDKVNPKARILAVRGPISRTIALKSGCNVPKIYGDPALTISEFYKPNKLEKFKLGIVPHMKDYNNIYNFWKHREDIRIINPRWAVEEVIDNITSCEKIISSSLHGLIVSDAYDIPNNWTESGRIGGDGTKFKDYFASVNRKGRKIIFGDIKSLSTNEIYNKIITEDKKINLKPLMECRPI